MDIIDPTLRALCNGSRNISLGASFSEETPQTIRDILHQDDIQQLLHDETALQIWDTTARLLGKRFSVEEIKGNRDNENMPNAIV